MGPRTFLTLLEFLWYNSSAVCGSSAWQLCDGANGGLFQDDLCHTPCLPGLMQPEPLSLWQATVDRPLCQRLLDTHSQVWVSLLWGHCSFLLGPGAHKIVFALQESVSPVLWNCVIKSHWPPKSNSLGFLSPFARSPG